MKRPVTERRRTDPRRTDPRRTDPRRTAWHVTDAAASAYAGGSLPQPDAWSLEKHVEACTACADRVSAAVRAGGAAAPLDGIRAAVLAEARRTAPAPAPAPIRRTAPGFRTGRLRLAWAAGPALRVPWLLAVLAVTAAAVAAAHLTEFGSARPLLLVLAPVLPLLGVAVSYGPHADHLHELTASTPGGGLRLLLVRTAAVLVTALPLLVVAGLLLPGAGRGPGPAACLLPSLALTCGALGLGSYLGCRTACAVLGAGWLLALMVLGGPALPELTGTVNSLTGGTAQGLWAAAAALATGLVATRRTAYDRMERP